MRPGILLALEGIDGAGKTTQVRTLAQCFKDLGMRVVTTKEPTSGPYGQAIRATAHTGRLPVAEELDLFEKDRAEHVRQLIEPELADGALVIVDRYYFSTAAYQGIRGMDPHEIVARNEAFAPRPDLLVVLDVPADVGVSRVRARDEVENLFERVDDLRRCREIFASFEGDDVIQVDAGQAPENVTRHIVEALWVGPLAARHPELRGVPLPEDLEDPNWRATARRALQSPDA